MAGKAASLVLTVLVLGGLCRAAAAGPAAYEPRRFEDEPGILFYLFQADEHWRDGVISVEKNPTTDCVTPPSALGFHFPNLESPPGWLEMDLNQAIRPEGAPAVLPPDTIGVSFYVKGDGSAAKARVEMRTDYRKSGPGVEFSLSDATWKRVLMTWADSEIDPAAEGDWGLAFGLAADSPRPAGYIVDAVRFVTTADENVELAAAAELARRNRGPFEIPRRVSPAACAYNKGGLARARAKVRNGDSIKWVAYGDSVTVPVQLWNVPEQYRDAYAYYRVAAAKLAKEYGSQISITVNAVGGRQLNEDFEGLIRTLEEDRPDVFIMQTGDTIRNYKVYMPKAIAKAREVGTEVLVVVPVYDAYPLRDPAVDWLREYCVTNGIACADARTYLLGIGEIYWGGMFANPYHPCPEGHMLMGEVLAEMFR